MLLPHLVDVANHHPVIIRQILSSSYLVIQLLLLLAWNFFVFTSFRNYGLYDVDIELMSHALAYAHQSSGPRFGLLDGGKSEQEPKPMTISAPRRLPVIDLANLDLRAER
mgnify:CR=1 FL=1